MRIGKSVLARQREKVRKLQKMGYSCYEYGNISYWNSPLKLAGRIISLGKDNKTGRLISNGKGFGFRLNNNKLLPYLDEGDIIGLTGTKEKNSHFHGNAIEILTKTMSPLSEAKKKYDERKNRHLRLILDKDFRKTILLRSQVISSLRKFLTEKGFVEIDCPLLHPYQGESSALPLFTDATTTGKRFALASSPELYLKRLLVGGFDKIFTIGKLFRDEIPDDTHLMEFLEIEYYMAHVDYHYMMDFTEELINYVIKSVNLNPSEINYQGVKIDFSSPWKRLSMRDSLTKKFGKDLYLLPLEKLIELANKNKIKFKGPTSTGNVIIKLFDKLIGEKIIQPTHVYDHPQDASVMCYDITMAKDKRGSPGALERFESFVMGSELTNCYSELNDPDKQRKAFDRFLKRHGKESKLKMDEHFDHALRIGMPPASGVGIGIDRLLKFLVDKKCIFDVIPFSTYHESQRETRQKTAN